MNRIRQPSPAIIVAVMALVAALAGTAIAGPDANTSASVKKQVKKLKKRVTALENQGQVPGPQGEQGPSGEAATNLFAFIRDPDSGSSTANVQYGSGVTGVSDAAGNGGNYEVTFNRSMVNCVVHVNVGFGDPRAGGNAFPMSIPLVNVGGSGSDDEVSVSFSDVQFAPSSVEVDSSFLITAFC